MWVDSASCLLQLSPGSPRTATRAFRLGPELLPRRPPIEGVGSPESLGEQLHQLQGEMRILPDQEVELRLVDLDQLGLREGDGARGPRRVIEEGHLAEDLLLGE